MNKTPSSVGPFYRNYNFLCGILLLIITPCILLLQSWRLETYNAPVLPHNKLIAKFKHYQNLGRLADACQCGVPDAMLILSRYHQRRNEQISAFNWLHFAAADCKSPAAMWLLAEWLAIHGSVAEAVNWKLKAIKLDSRLNSEAFQRQLKTAIDNQERRLYEN